MRRASKIESMTNTAICQLIFEWFYMYVGVETFISIVIINNIEYYFIWLFRQLFFIMRHQLLCIHTYTTYVPSNSYGIFIFCNAMFETKYHLCGWLCFSVLCDNEMEVDNVKLFAPKDNIHCILLLLLLLLLYVSHSLEALTIRIQNGFATANG